MEVRITIEARRVQAWLERLGAERLRAALRRGLVEALEYAAGAIRLEAHERGIRSRSGQLLNSILAQPAPGEALSGHVGVPEESPARKYAGLLTRRGIVPTRRRALTQPVFENLTAAGVARFASVADLEAAFGRRQIFRVGRYVGRWNESTQRFERYFLLRARVPGRDVLDPALRAAQPEMADVIEAQVAQELAD